MDIMKHLETISFLLGAASIFVLFIIIGEPVWWMIRELWLLRVLIVTIPTMVMAAVWYILIEYTVRGFASTELS